MGPGEPLPPLDREPLPGRHARAGATRRAAAARGGERAPDPPARRRPGLGGTEQRGDTDRAADADAALPAASPPRQAHPVTGTASIKGAGREATASPVQFWSSRGQKCTVSGEAQPRPSPTACTGQPDQAGSKPARRAERADPSTAPPRTGRHPSAPRNRTADGALPPRWTIL